MNHEPPMAQGPVDVNVSRLLADNKKLRHLLFMAHGSEEHYLYGDDGERSCNTCMIDFNTDSPDVIEQKIYAYNMRKIAQLQAEGKWPPEFLKTANAAMSGAEPALSAERPLDGTVIRGDGDGN